MSDTTKKAIWEAKDEVFAAEEFLNEQVPPRLQRSTWSQIWLWCGFGFFVTGLHVGGYLSDAMLLGGMPPLQAAFTGFLGMAILWALTSSLGVPAQQSGFNMALLATQAYGYRGRALPMGIMAIMTLAWFASITGMLGDIWGLFVGNPSGIVVLDPAYFGQPWIPPVTLEVFITCFIWGIIFTINAWRGVNAIEIIAKYTTPILFAAAIVVGLILLNNTGMGEFFNRANQLTGLPQGDAITFVVGSWIAGCIMGADYYRFNKSKKAVFVCAAACFLITNPVLHIVGYIGQVTEGNFNYFIWIFQLGPIFAFFACVGWTLHIWTTNNAELYCHTIYASSVLRAVNLKIRRHKILVTMGVVGTIIASTAFYQMFYVDFINILGSLCPVVAGPIIADYYFCRKEKYRQELLDAQPNFRWCGIISLAIGMGVAFLFLQTGVPFGLPGGILALVITIAVYVIMYKTFMPDRQVDDELMASLK